MTYRPDLVKPTRLFEKDYLDWVKTQRCYFAVFYNSDLKCDGPMDAHHVVPKGGGKTGSKTDDRRSIPTCRVHHQFAEGYPVHFREMFQPERMIRSLNMLYDSMRHPESVAQIVRSTVKTILIRCECGLTHRVPRNKVTVLPTGGVTYTYYCVRAKAERIAT